MTTSVADAGLHAPATVVTVEPDSRVEMITRLVLDRLGAAASKLAYRRALRDFLGWYARQPAARFDRATVQRYRTQLMDEGLAPSSGNQQLCAIRALAQEAADNGMVDAQLAAGVAKVKGVKSAGTRAGNWLTQAQAQALLDAPDADTLKAPATRRCWVCC